MTTHTVSLWEMGRTADSGQIAWMKPLDGGFGGAAQCGPAGLALQAIQTAAQFGIWFELHKMRSLMDAQFQERRHAWLNEIANQWIAEHRAQPGLRHDSTAALASEAEKFADVYTKDENVDIPEVLLLKIKRIGDYLDGVYALHAIAHNVTVNASGSSAEWLLPEQVDSGLIVLDILDREEHVAEAQAESNRASGWRRALGFIIPIIAVKRLIESKRARESQKTFVRAKAVHQLLRINVAMEGVQGAVRVRDDFMSRQELRPGTVLALSSNGSATSVCLRDPSAWRRFKIRFLGDQLLKALPAPANNFAN